MIGQCILTYSKLDELIIEQADETVEISETLLNQIAERPYHGVSLTGDVLTLIAGRRTVVYLVHRTRYNPFAMTFEMERLLDWISAIAPRVAGPHGRQEPPPRKSRRTA